MRQIIFKPVLQKMFKIITKRHQVILTAASHRIPNVLQDSWRIAHTSGWYRYYRFQSVKNYMQHQCLPFLGTPGCNFLHFLLCSVSIKCLCLIHKLLFYSFFFASLHHSLQLGNFRLYTTIVFREVSMCITLPAKL